MSTEGRLCSNAQLAGDCAMNRPRHPISDESSADIPRQQAGLTLAGKASDVAKPARLYAG
jgi:hypothetical protein